MACLIFFCSCEKQSSQEAKTSILVSIPPYQYFIDKISGGELHAQTIVPPGSNPHLFEPSPKQVEILRHASVWFCVGESFERKIAQVLKEQSPQLLIIDMKSNLSLLHASGHHCEYSHCNDHDDSMDLHIWLSPKMAIQQANTIYETLAKLYPEKKEIYAANTQAFLEELNLVDQEIAAQLESIKNRAVLVSHPAFGYFCRDYDLTQLSVECEGKDPLPQNISHTLHLAKEYQVQKVLLQPQYNNKGAEMIAEKLNLPTFLLDPYSRDYIANLRSLATAIAPKTPSHE
jgi:zinc transport system substrate-binding protein